jgi:hypothetical protein
MLRMRFPRVQEIDLRLHDADGLMGDSFARAYYDDRWLKTLAGLRSLTSLNLYGCSQVSDNGLLTLAAFTALSSLDLSHCCRVSDNGLRTVVSLIALTSLNLSYCKQVSDSVGPVEAGVASQ